MVVANPSFYQSAVPPPLVLIIEADKDMRLMLKYLLQIWHYNVIETAHAADAPEMIRMQKPAAVLLCSAAQEETNFAALRQLRELSPAAETGIIFIAAFSESSVHAAALNAGADGFLAKPIDFGHLEQLLEKNLQSKFPKKCFGTGTTL